jgi:predicted amidophosphoribosyltransferase
MVAASAFEGETRDAVLGLKYRNERANALVLATLLVPCVPAGTDLFTWAPTSDRRRMARGVDHAELITRHLGALTGIPVGRVLRRVGDGRQTGASREQRRHAVGFVAHGHPRGTHVVVVDDVVTTGSTMRAAVAALLAVGYGVVSCLSVAMVE